MFSVHFLLIYINHVFHTVLYINYNFKTAREPQSVVHILPTARHLILQIVLFNIPTFHIEVMSVILDVAIYN